MHLKKFLKKNSEGLFSPTTSKTYNIDFYSKICYPSSQLAVW